MRSICTLFLSYQDEDLSYVEFVLSSYQRGEEMMVLQGRVDRLVPQGYVLLVTDEAGEVLLHTAAPFAKSPELACLCSFLTARNIRVDAVVHALAGGLAKVSAELVDVTSREFPGARQVSFAVGVSSELSPSGSPRGLPMVANPLFRLQALAMISPPPDCSADLRVACPACSPESCVSCS